MTRRFFNQLIVGFLALPSSAVAATKNNQSPSKLKSHCNVHHHFGIENTHKHYSSLNHQRRQRWLDISYLKQPPTADDHLPTIRGGGIQDDGEERYNISLSALVCASIFVFLGGWTQIICNQQFDIYTAMMTGHFLNMSMLFAEKNWKETLWRLSIILSYIGGSASGRAIELKYEKRLQPGKGTEVNQFNNSNNKDNRHFKIIAPLIFVIFVVSDGLADQAKISLLAFDNRLIYPSISSSLGGTITHLMTGHPTNVSRLIGGNQIHHKGMKTSLCILSSIISGAVFGTKILGLLGDNFPYFSILGFFLWLCSFVIAMGISSVQA